MNSGPYRLILIFLVICVVSVLGVQAMWMRSLYQQKKEAFAQTVYSAMDQAAQKLGDRTRMRSVQQKLTLKEGKARRRAIEKSISIEERGHRFRIVTRDIEKEGRRTDSLVIVNEHADSALLPENPSRFTIVTPGHPVEAEEMELLMDRMLSEIRLQELEEDGADSIQVMVKKTLYNKGVFLPFEYAVKKSENGNDSIMHASEWFDFNKDYYQGDLSSGRVFRDNRFLMIQFPGLFKVLMKDMRSMLLLSIVFSLLIIVAAFYSFHLILKQKKISEMKADFVNNMTHELKTPIATISLALDSIARPEIRNNESRFSEYTRILKEENEKLNSHVERVLQMSQLDKNLLRLEQEAVDIVKVIEESRRTFALREKEQNATVHIFSEKDTPLVTGDRVHLRNVFNNLFDNAYKYCAKDCVINIHVQAKGDKVHVIFKDNGPGIAKDQQDKVFEKFYRVPSGNLHEVKGFGLGLSYVRSVLQAMEGEIELHSEAGRGSEFIITLNRHA